MTTATLPIHSFNLVNIFPSFDDINESITSKTEGENDVFKSCSRYMEQLSGVMSRGTSFTDSMQQLSEVISRGKSSTDSIGKCLVDPTVEIQKSQSLTTLIAIAREWISVDIADSLSEIHDYPLEEDELPLDLISVKNFLLYSFSKGLNKPILSATHEGLLQADWDNNEAAGTVAIRFLANDKAWVTTWTEEMRGTVEIKLMYLLADVTPLNLPSWANE